MKHADLICRYLCLVFTEARGDDRAPGAEADHDVVEGVVVVDALVVLAGL